MTNKNKEFDFSRKLDSIDYSLYSYYLKKRKSRLPKQIKEIKLRALTDAFNMLCRLINKSEKEQNSFIDQQIEINRKIFLIKCKDLFEQICWKIKKDKYCFINNSGSIHCVSSAQLDFGDKRIRLYGFTFNFPHDEMQFSYRTIEITESSINNVVIIEDQAFIDKLKSFINSKIELEKARKEFFENLVNNNGK